MEVSKVIKLKDLLLEHPSDFTDDDIDYIELIRRKKKYDIDSTRGAAEAFDAKPSGWSSSEAKSHMNNDISKMSKILGKASQQVIKVMMDGVKGGKYDAMDIIRGINTGDWNRTHDGERNFMKMLWRKVRDGFRRYSKNKKLRK